MKKKLLFGFMCLLVAAISVTAIACGDKGDGNSKNPPAHVHSAQHTAALAPTCTTAGNVDYWYCPDCGKYFSDGECTEELTADDVVVEATHHLRVPLEKYAREEATCTEDGNILYYKCQDCHKYFDSETATHEISQNATVIPAGHKNVEHVTKKDATCTEDGNKEYYHCFDCGKYFADSNYNTDITGDITLPAGHKNVEHVTRHEATCTEPGNKEYYHCRDCDKYFADSDYQTDITGDIILPAGHTFQTDYQMNLNEHWKKCENCEAVEQRAAHDFGNDNECDICGYNLPFTAGLQYENIDSDTCKVIGIGTATEETEIIIPVVHDGHKVVEIGNDALSGCSFAEITIPANVSSIGSYAFRNCTNLNTVNWNATNCTKAGASSFILWQAIFNGCTALTTVNIGENVGTIPAYAFYGCNKLTSITIPASVTYIGGGAFVGCVKLEKVNVTDFVAWCNIDFGGPSSNPLSNGANLYISDVLQQEITIPQEVTEIKGYAFAGCNATSIVIHNGVTSIGNYAFSNCSKVVEITIPASVISIGDEAFKSCYNLQAILFASDSKLVSISKEMFYCCSKLTEITIPASVISIGSSAFYKCTNLQTVTFTGDSELESFGSDAFEECSNLTGITIPTGVNAIGSNAFRNCANLQTVNWNATNCTEALGIGSSAIFYNCTSLTTINIGENVEIIPANAFYCCSKLTEITIPANVTSIGEVAFGYCDDLQTVNWNATNCTKVGSFDSSYSDYTIFKGCPSLTTINIGENVQTIPDYAFCGCNSFTEIMIPASVTSIGKYAFYKCSNLTEITIPANVTSIGNYAFYGCANLQTVNWNATNCNHAGSTLNPIFRYCTTITTVNIGKNVQTIPYATFYACDNLETVTFSDESKLKSIGGSAFSSCSRLMSITIPASVTDIGDMAFLSCYKLIEICNNSSLQIVAGQSDYGNVAQCAKNVYSSIAGASKLTKHNDYYIFYEDSEKNEYYFMSYAGEQTELSLPEIEHDYEIYEYAFYGCSKLTVITIPKNVTFIGGYAFEGCTDLQAVTFGDESKLKSIDTYAFYGCSGLMSIEIPASVTSIDWGAFRSCTTLQTVTFGDESKLKSIDTYAFYGCSGLMSIEIPASVTSIGSSAFYGCSSLAEITIPANVISIAQGAFSKSGLQKIIVDSGNEKYYSDGKCLIERESNTLILGCNTNTIPFGVISIGSSAFSGCDFTTITIPTSVTSIGSSAFSFCANLQTVIFESESKLDSISFNAFEGCGNLTTITIPEKVTSIGYYAFFGCTNLQTVNFENNDGWEVSSSSDMSNANDILPTDLQDQTKAAKYLCKDSHNGGYSNYWWQRS